MKEIVAVLALVSIVGCTNLVQKEALLQDGSKVTYVLGRVANAGQEAVFRDAYRADGTLIIGQFGNGQSLAGAALQGAVAGAAQGAGAAYGLSHIKPARTNINNSNAQGQGQAQGQAQGQVQGQAQGQIAGGGAGGQGGSGGQGGEGGHGGHDGHGGNSSVHGDNNPGQGGGGPHDD